MYIEFGAVSSGDEPVSVDDLKAHLRIDASTEDAHIALLRTSAREYVEKNVTGRLLLAPRSASVYLERFPSGNGLIGLPATIGGSSAVALGYRDVGGSTITVASTDYVVKTPSGGPGEIVPSQSWPDTEILDSGKRHPQAVEVTLTAGTTLVPELAKQAIRLIAGDWYENREAEVIGSISQELKVGIDRIAGLLHWGFYR